MREGYDAAFYYNVFQYIEDKNFLSGYKLIVCNDLSSKFSLSEKKDLLLFLVSQLSLPLDDLENSKVFKSYHSILSNKLDAKERDQISFEAIKLLLITQYQLSQNVSQSKKTAESKLQENITASGNYRKSLTMLTVGLGVFAVGACLVTSDKCDNTQATLGLK